MRADWLERNYCWGWKRNCYAGKLSAGGLVGTSDLDKRSRQTIVNEIAEIRRAGYTQDREKVLGWRVVKMSRLVLVAVVLIQGTFFQGTAVFCQSPATPLESPQISGNGSMGQLPFDFSGGQSGLTAAKPSFKSFRWEGPNSAANQASAPIDFYNLFSAPRADLKTHLEFFARNENSFSRSPLVVQPHLKGEPIPTQWPNAKAEQIPTLWPNLKLQPINSGSLGLDTVRTSKK
jgi:hypothetical protein